MTEPINPTQPMTGNCNISPSRAVQAMELRTNGDRFLKFQPQFSIVEEGFDLCLELIHILGDCAPKNETENAIRDVACDTFDSLWHARHLILSGCENHAIVLLRRAYETNSLLATFIQSESLAKKWIDGGEVKAADTRKFLDTAALREPADDMRGMYSMYCKFSHPNRHFVFMRLLGEGNRWTVGAQGNSPDALVEGVVRELLHLLMWFVDVFHYAFKERFVVATEIRQWQLMLSYRGRVQAVAKELDSLY
jgi:hypothetical protein